ncbi:MAG: GNAT family N-acetyltransferase [Rhodospirillaceae bacterium]|nr:GNAT family N-acetyltransferase [Rhodospirillaceae bacterium]MCY4237112.1 GNAT family N-acetyltransferase [Rhodospirillaceae bacterium]MCY4311639.1 GNAT family N-acetyltransferase [Rhodospirillaceae bacterium]
MTAIPLLNPLETEGFAARQIDESAGGLRVRLAETQAEIDAALALRYRVFYEEMSAKASEEVARLERDFDDFDGFCDHLIVLDEEMGQGPESVVGTYRMLRRAGAEKIGRFYSAAEYNIDKLVAQAGEILEMGRSCIDADHRTRAAMQLLWRGVTAYILTSNIAFLFGCASMHGTDPQALAIPLAYLHHNHLAPERFRPRAVADRYIDMDLLPAEEIDQKAALHDLPPMIKGYLRLGGVVGDGAVIDHEFNTVDVCVVVETAMVSDRYLRHYTREIDRAMKRAGTDSRSAEP